MKAQIALEFLIVISLVIIVFLFLFFIISSQRTNGLSSQSFSQLQLVSQSLSSQIYKAYTSGSGYSAQISLYSSSNTRPYNVTITKDGIVILQQVVGSQHIQAISYSGVPILSNSSYLISGSSTAYLIPVTNGTISITDSFGTICVDYSCPTSSNTLISLSLSSQNTYSAQFNGQNTYISMPSTSALKSYTVSAWIYNFNNPNIVTGRNDIVDGYDFYLNIQNNQICGYIQSVSSSYLCTGSGNTIKQNSWTFVAETWSGSTITMYINGMPIVSSSVSGTPTSLTSSIGNCAACGDTGYWNGKLSNIQVYNASLSSNQIYSLYSGGIASPPIIPANIVGWWPLSGNTNDFSGDSNNGQQHGFINFPSVSQIFATVRSSTNNPVPNALVGFASSSGNFTFQGASSNYTNANGIAIAFLEPNNYVSSYATVKAVVYNGNMSSQGLLYEWLPSNLGQGNVIYDNGPLNLEGYSNNGVYWNSPNYAASFDGHSAIVSLPPSAPINPGNAMTIAAWFKTTSDGVIVGVQNSAQPSASSSYSSLLYVNTNGFLAGGEYTSTYPFSTSLNVSNDQWNLAVLTSSGSTQTLYLNGIQVATASGTAQSITSPFWTVGEGYASGWPSAPQTEPFYFNGSISNVQFYSNVLTSNQISQLYQNGINSAPANTANLIGWYPLDGDSNDYSGKGYNANIYGNLRFTNINIIPTQINQSSMLYANFAGSAYDYINVSDPSSFNFASAYTIIGWINIHTFTNEENIITKTSPSGWASGGKEIYVTSSGALTYNTYGIAPLSSANVIGANTLYQFAVTSNANTVTLYLNGVQVGTTNYGTISADASNGVIHIGQQTDGTSPFNGIIENLQFYNSTLSQSQIQSLYQQGVVSIPLQNSNLSAWWPLNGNASDFSSHGKNGIQSNVVYTNNAGYPPSWTSQTSTYGINLNGVNGYVNLPYNALSTEKSYTIAGWFNFRSFANVPALYSYDNNGEKLFVNTNRNVISEIYDGSADSNAYSTTALNPNVWYFIVQTVSYNSIAGTTTHSIWVNGVNQSTATFTGSVVTGSSGSSIGSIWKQYQFLNGSVSDFQIYNGALNAQQIQQLYYAGMPKTYSISVPTGWSP